MDARQRRTALHSARRCILLADVPTRRRPAMAAVIIVESSELLIDSHSALMTLHTSNRIPLFHPTQPASLCNQSRRPEPNNELLHPSCPSPVALLSRSRLPNRDRQSRPARPPPKPWNRQPGALAQSHDFRHHRLCAALATSPVCCCQRHDQDARCEEICCT